MDENLFFGVGAVESGYLTAACHGLASFNDPNYVPLRVAISFLTAMEGPLWKLIRFVHYFVVCSLRLGTFCVCGRVCGVSLCDVFVEWKNVVQGGGVAGSILWWAAFLRLCETRTVNLESNLLRTLPSNTRTHAYTHIHTCTRAAP